MQAVEGVGSSVLGGDVGRDVGRAEMKEVDLTRRICHLEELTPK